MDLKTLSAYFLLFTFVTALVAVVSNDFRNYIMSSWMVLVTGGVYLARTVWPPCDAWPIGMYIKSAGELLNRELSGSCQANERDEL